MVGLRSFFRGREVRESLEAIGACRAFNFAHRYGTGYVEPKWTVDGKKLFVSFWFPFVASEAGRVFDSKAKPSPLRRLWWKFSDPMIEHITAGGFDGLIGNWNLFIPVNEKVPLFSRWKSEVVQKDTNLLNVIAQQPINKGKTLCLQSPSKCCSLYCFNPD